MGKFPDAERHYSRALRYGGGEPVARSLAAFYIQTSNYASAVRVLRYLLDTTEDPRPIYNNLGTALMYAGETLDAESYLMIAQQIDPKNPVPYVNLGLLYDRHIKRQALAIEFYSCYLQMSQDGAQRRSIETRMRELLPPEAPAVEHREVFCGKPYTPRQPDLASAGVVDLGLGGEEPAGEPSSQPAGPIAIERGVDEPRLPGTTDPKATAEPADPEGDAMRAEGIRTRAAEMLERKRFDEAIQLLLRFKLNELTARDSLMLAEAHRGLGREQEAENWLRQSLFHEVTPEALSMLLRRLEETRRVDEIRGLCAQYASDERVAEVVAERCGTL